MNKIDLSIYNTKLANQRTYLAYVRTGFVIAGVAGIFKKKWIAFCGLIMIILSTYQYYLLNDDLNNRIELNNGFYDNMPIIYVMLSAGALYLQIKN
jgi:hypothetical protein